MSVTDEVGFDDPRETMDEDPPSSAGEGRVLLEEVRKRRRELESEREPMELDIPGYEGLVVAKYQPVPFEELKKIADKVEKLQRKKNPRAELFGMMDTLIWANVSLHIRDRNGALQNLDPDDPSVVTYGSLERLQPLLELPFEPKSARQAVFLLFVKNELAIAQHHNEYTTWLGDASKDDQETLLGESSGTR